MPFGPIAKLIRQVAAALLRMKEAAAWLSYIRSGMRARYRFGVRTPSPETHLRDPARAPGIVWQEEHATVRRPTAGAQEPGAGTS